MLSRRHAIAVSAFFSATRRLAGAEALRPNGTADISRVLEAAVARGDTAGVVSAVVGRGGLLYSGSAGKANTNDIFSIASMTKPVTSVAIMMLIEQGKLKLDDTVSQYLPGFDHLQVLTKLDDTDGKVETRPATVALTVRHLLTHTSGFAYPFCNTTETRLVKVTKKTEFETPLLNDPGRQWLYSPSTRLLGQIVEKISGNTLEDFFQKNILVPLGMMDTSFAVAQEKQSRVAAKYRRVNGALQPMSMGTAPSTPKPPFLGDGGLYSTAADYARFIQMFLNAGRFGSTRILSESSVKMMGQNQIGDAFVEQQAGPDQSFAKPFPLGAGRDKFGLGFQITAAGPDGGKFRSPGSMSWAGIFNTEFWIDPVKHIGGVQMMQSLPFYDDGAIRTLRDFEEAVYRNLR